MKKTAIIQSSYLPWKGFFDIINAVDVFVFLEDVQFTKRDWRSRNKIKMKDGTTRWLTVPVKGGRDQLICDVEISHDKDWRRQHLESCRHSYGKAPHFARYFDLLGEVFDRKPSLLSELNIALTKALCADLGIETEFVNSADLGIGGAKDDKLVGIVKVVGGDLYLSGPSARGYIRPEIFRDSGIELAYATYADYPEYEQISEPFEHFVSVIDLLFMKGQEAPKYIWENRPSIIEAAE